MLDFCGEHHLTDDVEVIPIQQVNEAYGRLTKAEVPLLHLNGDHLICVVSRRADLAEDTDAEPERFYFGPATVGGRTRRT